MIFLLKLKLLGLCYRNTTTIATVGLTEAKSIEFPIGQGQYHQHT